MSTEQTQIPTRPSLLNNNTVARSMQTEKRDPRVAPPDMRTRRFGYNPGFLMQQDPVVTGLQRVLIEPGVIILFESGPVSRQNWSVDPEDNSPANVIVDLLAGDGLHSIYEQHSHMGFRELESLRGLDDVRAEQLFYTVHPPLDECVAAGLIPACPYDLTVCITCRSKALAAMRKSTLPTSVASLFGEVEASVTIGRSYMAEEWAKWTGEVAGSQTGTNHQPLALGQLKEGHLFFMRQLHERTPNEQELAKIAMNASAQATIMKEAMKEQGEILAAAMREGRGESPELAFMRQQMAIMQEQLAALGVIVQNAAQPQQPTTEVAAPATTKKEKQDKPE